MLNWFKKKEEPEKEYSLTEICVSYISVQEVSYIPNRVAYYKTHVDFCIERIFGEELEAFNLSVERSGERYLPLKIDDAPLYWDTQDNSFRVFFCPEGEPQPLCPQVLLYPNGVMTMEESFAEAWFSEEALSYAMHCENLYSWYCPDFSASPVVFEHPKLFEAFLKDSDSGLCPRDVMIVRNLSTHTPCYLEKMGITAGNILEAYSKNIKKTTV